MQKLSSIRSADEHAKESLHPLSWAKSVVNRAILRKLVYCWFMLTCNVWLSPPADTSPSPFMKCSPPAAHHTVPLLRRRAAQKRGLVWWWSLAFCPCLFVNQLLWCGFVWWPPSLSGALPALMWVPPWAAALSGGHPCSSVGFSRGVVILLLCCLLCVCPCSGMCSRFSFLCGVSPAPRGCCPF